MNNKRHKNAYAVLKNFLIIPLGALIIIAYSCNNTNSHKKESASNKGGGKELTQMQMTNPEGSQNREPFVVVQQMPQFPGGEKKMMKFIKRNIKYPEKAKKDNIQGTVILNFVINKEGSITDTRILRTPDKLLSEEALKVIHLMPTWIPGKEKGEPVSVAYTLPISFNLSTRKSS